MSHFDQNTQSAISIAQLGSLAGMALAWHTIDVCIASDTPNAYAVFLSAVGFGFLLISAFWDAATIDKLNKYRVLVWKVGGFLVLYPQVFVWLEINRAYEDVLVGASALVIVCYVALSLLQSASILRKLQRNRDNIGKN